MTHPRSYALKTSPPGLAWSSPIDITSLLHPVPPSPWATTQHVHAVRGNYSGQSQRGNNYQHREVGIQLSSSIKNSCNMVHEITINMVHEITINMVHEITINTERLPPCIRLYILHTMQYAQVQIPVIQQGSINRLKEIISTLSEYTRKQISSTLIELLFSCSWWVPNHLFCKFVFTDFQITPPPPPQPPESNPLNTVLLFAWQRELRSDMFHSRWKSVQNKRPFVGILATHWHWQGYCHQEKTRLHFLFLLVCLFCKCLWTKWPIKTQHKFWPSWHPLHQLLPLQGTPPETKINPCMCVWVQGCAEDLDRLFFFEGGGGCIQGSFGTPPFLLTQRLTTHAYTLHTLLMNLQHRPQYLEGLFEVLRFAFLQGPQSVLDDVGPWDHDHKHGTDGVDGHEESHQVASVHLLHGILHNNAGQVNASCISQDSYRQG